MGPPRQLLFITQKTHLNSFYQEVKRILFPDKNDEILDFAALQVGHCSQVPH